MAEYIDREKILFELFEAYDSIDPRFSRGRAIREAIVLIKKEINAIPAADVAPVKHGKWRWNQNGMDWGLGAWECSECACRNNNLPMNEKINPLVFSGSKYCPNCGVKMDMEE